MLHPQTEHSHSHGLTLENHTEGKDYILRGFEGSYGGSESHHQYETVENNHEFDGGSSGASIGGGHSAELSRHQFQDITVHHGHGESE